MSEPDDDLECYCGECAHVGSIHITGRGCAHEHCSCPQFVETPPVPACPSCTALRQQLDQAQQERDEWQRNSEWNFKRLQSVDQLYGHLLAKCEALEAVNADLQKRVKT